MQYGRIEDKNADEYNRRGEYAIIRQEEEEEQEES